MKDKNNLLTSLIVALLAGVVYYLAGADSIEKIMPQISQVESKSGKTNDIEIIISKVRNEEQDLAENQPKRVPKKLRIKKFKQEDPGIDFEPVEEKEMASGPLAPKMNFDELMAMLKNPLEITGTDELKLTKSDETQGSFEWKEEEPAEIEKPAFAWTKGEYSKSVKEKVKTKIPRVYSKAKAAKYVKDVKLKKKNKNENKNTKGSIEETGTSTHNNRSSVPASDTNPKIEGSSHPDGLNVILDAKDVQNNVKVKVKTSFTKDSKGYNFIIIQSDDDCQTKCESKCTTK